MDQIKPIGGSTVFLQPSRSSQPVTTDNPPKPAKDISPRYVSPKGAIDPESGVFVTEVRDTGTGKVSFQYPSKKAVAAYTSNAPAKTEEGQQQSNVNEGNAGSGQSAEFSTIGDAVTDDTKGQE